MCQVWCLKKTLFPYLEHHHPCGEYLFWPELIASHHARETLELLDNSHVQFVPCEENLSNMPQLRQIEYY